MVEVAIGKASLEVTGLSLRRDSASLGPISFRLPSAGCWWLAGVSGAGKSLLMESLAGLHVEAQGSIRVCGEEISQCAPERRSVALMPQRWRLFPHWSVARNLRFAAQLAKRGGIGLKQSSADRIDELTEQLKVEHLLDRRPKALSGGETQRIALIQTLLTGARVMLLDEPLSAMDAALQSVALDLLQAECARDQRICLIAAHKPLPGHPLAGVLRIDRGRLFETMETSAAE